MKIPPSRRGRGFTLVELLVVIAIIAVLAAAGFAAGNAAIQKARKVTSLATATAIESAVNNFFTEYGSMPSASTSEVPINTDVSEGITLCRVLLGLEPSTGTMLNTRAVKFLSVKDGKNKKGGMIYTSNGNDITGLYDPWGGPYNVLLDLDFDDKVDPPKVGDDALDRGKLVKRVAIWSAGADKVAGGNNKGDDVKSW